MGYFPNGTSGADYQEQYCVRCVHDINEDCPVWLLHLLYNYDAAGKTPDKTAKTVLDTLIPRSPNGLGNDQCKMFVEKSETKPVWNIEGIARPGTTPGAAKLCSCGRFTHGDPNNCKHLEPNRMF